MKLSPQKERIVRILRDMEWHCGSEWLEGMKDDRKRISELNDGYMREKGYKIIGQKCDGRCGKTHSSNLFMRKAVKIELTFEQRYAKWNEWACKNFDILSPEELFLKCPVQTV